MRGTSGLVPGPVRPGVPNRLPPEPPPPPALPLPETPPPGVPGPTGCPGVNVEVDASGFVGRGDKERPLPVLGVPEGIVLGDAPDRREGECRSVGVYEGAGPTPGREGGMGGGLEGKIPLFVPLRGRGELLLLLLLFIIIPVDAEL